MAVCTNSAKTQPDSKGGSVNQGAPPGIDTPLGFDFTSGALLMALAFFIWARLRA
jgi:hypothetical protein